MTEQYTPTTDEVRANYQIPGLFVGESADESGEQFDRWLAEVERAAAEKAEREIERRTARLEHFESEYNLLETVVENMHRLLQRVRELHTRDDGYCRACDRLYPCPMIRALEGDE